MLSINSLVAGRGAGSPEYGWEGLEGLRRQLCGPGAVIVYQQISNYFPIFGKLSD